MDVTQNTPQTEQEARTEILKAVREYTDKFHKKAPYKEGDRIPYAGRVYDRQELCSLVDASLDFWLTAGRYADRFEKDFARFLKVRHCSVVNSGSSANLLAFMALTSPLLKERKINRGDEVITVAAGFPTTVSPMIQYGAVPVFVDVTLKDYNIDTAQLEAALSPRTKAVMIAHTLGNPFDIASVKAFCDKHNLWLVEDNCDALGSEYCLDGQWRYTGTMGDIGTSSFYPAHHMTMGEGGAVYTNDALLHKIVRSFRDWGRDCACPAGCDNLCGHRFDRQYGTLPLGYDHKYVYSHFGYNLKVTDMQVAIGCAQLEKLPQIIEGRKKNWQLLHDGLLPLADKLLLPEPQVNSRPSWFGFLVTVKENAGITRNGLVGYLESQKIQTRMLFAGNMLRHPCFTDSDLINGKDYRVIGTLENTDRIMNNSFWLGVYPGMTKTMVQVMSQAIRHYFDTIKEA